MSFASLALVAGLTAFVVWWSVLRLEEGRDPTADLREALGMPAAPQRPARPFRPWMLTGAISMLILSWGAFRWLESRFLGYAVAGLLAFSAGRRLCSALGRLTWPRILARPGPGFAGVLLLVAAAWSLNGDVRSRKAEAAVARARDAAVVAVSEEQRPWRAGAGVAEAAMGPFLAWMAVPAYVAVDASHEADLETSGRAERLIPVDVVILNNSFADAELYPDGIDGRLWRAWVTRDGSDEVLAEWSARWPEGRALFEPARRVDFPVDWDGRDRTGALVPPGEYRAHLEMAPAVPGGRPVRLELAVAIRDDGPVVVESPATSWPRRMLEDQRMMDQMRRNMEMWQRIQFDGLRPR